MKDEIWQEKVNRHGWIIEDEKEQMTLLRDKLQELHDELCRDEKYHAAGSLSVTISEIDRRLNPEKY